MNKQSKTMRLTLMGLFAAVLLLMAYTPLGYLNIGPLAITFNVIPVALAAITLGPVGGAAMGAVFGLTSFLQCIGVGGTSAMGAMLFGINPVLAFIQRFIPRLLDGFLLGYVFRYSRKAVGDRIACMITGFCSAFFKTACFMSVLVRLVGKSSAGQGVLGGIDASVCSCSFVGVNAVFEMCASTFLTGAVGLALIKAKVIPVYQKARSAA